MEIDEIIDKWFKNLFNSSSIKCLFPIYFKRKQITYAYIVNTKQLKKAIKILKNNILKNLQNLGISKHRLKTIIDSQFVILYFSCIDFLSPQFNIEYIYLPEFIKWKENLKKKIKKYLRKEVRKKLKKEAKNGDKKRILF